MPFMSRNRIVLVAAACLALAGIAGASWYWRTTTLQPRGLEVIVPIGAVAGDYVGPQGCAPCHAAIYERQTSSRMASALHTVADYQRRFGLLPEGTVYDATHHVQYQIVRRGDGLVMRVEGASQDAELPMTYALGAGGHGVSFVEETATSFRELRVAFYADSGDWDFTPGQEKIGTLSSFDQLLGVSTGKRLTKTCLGCHSTLLVARNGFVDPGRSQFGVTCERCHGPGREHVEAARRGKLVPPRNRRVEAYGETFREVNLCGECHGMARFDASDLRLAQFAVTALQKSECYQRSLGDLRCTDCHDPHSNAVHGEHTPYARVCLSCHQGTPADSTAPLTAALPGLSPRRSAPDAAPPCPINPRDECITCHMPTRHPVYRSTFHHHRIAIHPHASAETPSDPVETEAAE
jgi:hypothetical protein